MEELKKIGFGGGCHWCTEAVFQALKGVENVEQGWISSKKPFDSFSEAVIVHYNENKINLKSLIEIHLLTHSSTSNHSFREKYRSAIYFFDKKEEDVILKNLNNLKEENNLDYITQVLIFEDFKLNKKSFLNYYQNNKKSPFCETYISPKLSNIRKKFGKNVKADF